MIFEEARQLLYGSTQCNRGKSTTTRAAVSSQARVPAPSRHGENLAWNRPLQHDTQEKICVKNSTVDRPTKDYISNASIYGRSRMN